DLVEDVRVQARVAVPSSPRIVAIGMLTRGDVRRAMAAADVVVTHGGSGSCLEAVAIGHVPVIVPRRRSLGEAADDHQSDLANELARRGLAVVAEDPLDPGLSHAVLEAARVRSRGRSGGRRPPPRGSGDAARSPARARSLRPRDRSRTRHA
ncbi:MAG TPA: glycosyltransferase, partial [Planctomycetota bacterium]|nr:glycosyltransferase [Planctomycetota bacterium]